MRHAKSFLIACTFIYAGLFSLSELAANLSTAFPPPPSAVLTVPIIVLECTR